MQQAAGRILVTGATGYVGGRLLRKLEESGRPVRCMVRRPEALSGRTATRTEIVRGDVLEPDSLHGALAGVTTAYYLVHSMAASGPFADAGRRGAENFAAAVREYALFPVHFLIFAGMLRRIGRVASSTAAGPTTAQVLSGSVQRSMTTMLPDTTRCRNSKQPPVDG